MQWWFHNSELDLDIPEELDEAMVTYQVIRRLPKSKTGILLAAIERALPHMKKRLPWYKMVSDELIQYVGAVHAQAMPWVACLPLAAFISQNVSLRLGALLIVQHSRGLRTMEVVGISGESILLPEETLYSVGVLSLGFKSKIKVGVPNL